MPHEPGPPATIQFDGVTYGPNGHTRIIDGLTLGVSRGETLVLLGRSGSGKTTTLKLINRLLEPSQGRVLVDGRDTLEWDPIRLRRQIGYVIQEVGLFPHFTVEQNVGLVPLLEAWPASRIRSRTREMLELAGLSAEEFGHRYPDELSGGQRQRVGVARALAGEPSILLLDEPFGALDPVTRRQIRSEFCALRDRLDVTMVFVTHDVAEALLIADRIALMKSGALVASVLPEEFQELDDPEARLFMEGLGG